jgi:hypothetical protein
MEYTEIIKATEVVGCPVSVHFSPDAPAWLIERVTAFVRELADAEGAAPKPDAFEEAMDAITDLHRVHRAFRALDARLRKLEGRG